MGANLLTYIVWHAGKEIPNEHLEDARKLATEIHDLATIWQPKLAEAEDPGELLESDEFPALLYDILDTMEFYGNYDPTEPEENCKVVLQLTTQGSVEEMLRVITEGTARDIAARPAEIGGTVVRIIVAGEMSWGDVPEGLGYTTLSHIFLLGLNDPLGLR